MEIFLGENQTKRTVLMLLKKSGGMTIEELSKSIHITPMGVRQHILNLEQKGFVKFCPRRDGIGRPEFVYHLTERAEAFFPKVYDTFALDILSEIESREGKERVDELFSLRYRKLFQKRRDAIPKRDDVEWTMQRLKKVLKSEGNYVEIWRKNGSYFLMQYNCPIHRIAMQYHNPCHHELEMYRELTGSEVVMKESMSLGSHACLFEIPLT